MTEKIAADRPTTTKLSPKERLQKQKEKLEQKKYALQQEASRIRRAAASLDRRARTAQLVVLGLVCESLAREAPNIIEDTLSPCIEYLTRESDKKTFKTAIELLKAGKPLGLPED